MSCREPRSVSEAVDALRMREQRAAAAAASAQQLQHTENLYARVSRGGGEEIEEGGVR